MKSLLYSLVAVLVTTSAALKSQTLSMEQLTIEDGLPQGMIYDILQTRDGFLWVGTKDGLNRYDGYNFRSWKTDPYNPYSLGDNTPTAFFEDSRGWMWIGGESKGLHLFDRNTERFYHFNLPVANTEKTSIVHDVRQIIEDKSGDIWVINRASGAFKLVIPKEWGKSIPDEDTLEKYARLSAVPIPVNLLHAGTEPEQFRSICIAGDRHVWVSTSKQIYEINTHTLQVSVLATPPEFFNKATFLANYGKDRIWGACWKGLFLYQNNQFEYFPFFDGVKKSSDPILIPDPNNGLLIANDKDLWTIDPTKRPQPKAPDYTVDRIISSIKFDNQGNIWVGTFGYGLRKITPRKKLFNSRLPGESVWNLWQLSNGDVLIKKFNEIYNYDPKTDALSKQKSFPDAMPQQNDIVFEPSGNIWLLCGLRDEQNNLCQLRKYSADKKLIKAYDVKIERYPYAKMLYSSEGVLWVSGAAGQLTRFDPLTGKADYYDLQWLFGENGPSVNILALAEDGNGHLWIGTQFGLVRAIYKPGGQLNDFELYKSNSADKKGLNNSSVSCILPDPQYPKDILWIGTKGGGVNRMDINKKEFTYIFRDHGLPNDVVYGILPDKQGHLWCSTNRGLAKIELKDRQLVYIHNYNTRDGLQDNEFNTQSFFKSPDGILFFGGIAGFNWFRPSDIHFKSEIPNVTIVGLEINKEPVRYAYGKGLLPAPLELIDQLNLSYNQNNISFEFSALDLSDPSKNQYKYQLWPLEKKWILARGEHLAHYTHLPPGHYIFKVIGSNSNGLWNNKPVEVRLTIRPPWWATRLAYLIYLSIGFVILWQIFRARIRNIRLKDQVIAEQRERERVAVLEQMKTNFFSNITHEFRTPITLIIEPLRQILQNREASVTPWISMVRTAENNSRKLLRLVNQLLDLAKLESGAMTADYRLGQPGVLIRAISKAFEDAATAKAIQMTCTVPEADTSYLFDKDKLEKITVNLISNALKFTPHNGKVDINLTISSQGEAQSVNPSVMVLTVKDNGIGIDTSALGKVFERFYQAGSSNNKEYSGTGIGLALCRELAELMGGKIEVESSIGQGATFTLRIPLKYPDSTQEQTAGIYDSDDALNFTKLAATERVAYDKAGQTNNEEISTGNNPLLLLVEDNDELRAFLYQILSAHFDVLEASNGEEAVALALSQVPDIIVSDLVMPKKDGIGLLDAIKQNPVTCHIPFVLLTAKTALESRLQGLRHGAEAYLNKPFNTEELLAWLFNLLENRKRMQENFQKNTFTPAPEENDNRPRLNEMDRQFINRLIEVAEQELENENLSSEDLAKRMTMSRSQLHRKLTAVTGQSAGEFLRNYRLDRAMQLLKNGEGNVTEIAWRVGFVNTKHFSTSFKERFGFPPSEVRAAG